MTFTWVRYGWVGKSRQGWVGEDWVGKSKRQLGEKRLSGKKREKNIGVNLEIWYLHEWERIEGENAREIENMEEKGAGRCCLDLEENSSCLDLEESRPWLDLEESSSWSGLTIERARLLQEDFFLYLLCFALCFCFLLLCCFCLLLFCCCWFARPQ